MQITTVLFVIAAVLVALGIALFQYYYKTKKRTKVQAVLSILRFCALLGLFLLLINPKFTKNSYTVEKPNLILLTDNSSSIASAKGAKVVTERLAALQSNEDLNNQFKIHPYNFGKDIYSGDSLNFQDQHTNITRALQAINTIYPAENSPVVLLTDGNQTLGEDYEFYGQRQDLPIYPISVGDTTQYEDLRIGQVNINKYAFLDNKYPLEALISYKVKTIKVVVAPLKEERNTFNNQKQLAVEVIDEKTNVAIISSITHPDIGVLKKAIERNEQRVVQIYKPSVALAKLNEVNLFILYQPNAAFKNVYTYIEQKSANTFTITGKKTDWNFLNGVQEKFTKNSYNQSEEISPTLNTGFTIFNNADFNIIDFPPLTNNLGEITINASYEKLLGQRVKGIALDDPLFVVLDNNTERDAVLFGEGIWKWRLQSFRNDRDFSNFDTFIGKLMRYLATSKPKTRLSVDFESVYSGGNDAVIAATYFDKAFAFDGNASLSIRIKSDDNILNRELPMLLKNGYYETDLSTLPAGNFNFTVKVKDENLTRSGSFTILDFDVEQQFLSSNYKKLGRLADATNGKLYFPNNMDGLTKVLIEDKRFTPIQKGTQNIVSLIDFKTLLGIIVLALALEWVIRKYNGLI